MQEERKAPVEAGWITVGLTAIVPFLAIVAVIVGAIVTARGRSGHGVAIMVVAIVVAVVRYQLAYG